MDSESDMISRQCSRPFSTHTQKVGVNMRNLTCIGWQYHSTTYRLMAREEAANSRQCTRR